MRLFRIARTGFIQDLSGAGSRMYGGRWNRKGTALLYTSETRALAALEYLVHVPLALAPPDLSLLPIDVPDEIQVKALEAASLPPGWKAYPPPQSLAALGTRWAQSGETLLLRVPSVVVDDEFNYLVNPFHPQFKRLRPHPPKRFTLDPRLLGQRKP
jgi:RES domain-containing protein